MINAVGNRMTREIARQQKLADQIERTQIQISSGKRLQRMSDDPVAARRIQTIGTTQASMASWATNVKTAQAQASQADGVLKSTSDLLIRARELTLSASSDTASPASLLDAVRCESPSTHSQSGMPMTAMSHSFQSGSGPTCG